MFEIVIVKNYPGGFSRNSEFQPKIIEIITEEETLYAKLIVGMEKSSGDIITFLEDDDTFYKHKLRKIAEEFNLDNDVVYVHNAHSLIDSRGSRIGREFQKNTAERLVFDGTNDGISKFRKILRYSPDFNLSSITVRKELFLDILKKHSPVKEALDSLLFHIAISSGKKVLIIPDRLTHYRHHNSASNPIDRGNQTIGKGYDYVIRYTESLISIKEYWLSEMSRMAISCNIIDMRANAFIYNTSLSWRQLIRNSLSYPSCIITFRSSYYLLKFLLSIGLILAPNFMRKTYFRKKKGYTE